MLLERTMYLQTHDISNQKIGLKLLLHIGFC